MCPTGQQWKTSIGAQRHPPVELQHIEEARLSLRGDMAVINRHQAYPNHISVRDAACFANRTDSMTGAPGRAPVTNPHAPGLASVRVELLFWKVPRVPHHLHHVDRSRTDAGFSRGVRDNDRGAPNNGGDKGDRSESSSFAHSVFSSAGKHTRALAVQSFGCKQHGASRPLANDRATSAATPTSAPTQARCTTLATTNHNRLPLDISQGYCHGIPDRELMVAIFAGNRPPERAA